MPRTSAGQLEFPPAHFTSRCLQGCCPKHKPPDKLRPIEDVLSPEQIVCLGSILHCCFVFVSCALPQGACFRGCESDVWNSPIWIK